MTNTQDTERASFDPSVSAPPPSAEKASLFEDFIDIFYAPSSVFARREKSGYWGYFFIVWVVTAGFLFASRSVMSVVMHAESARQTAKMLEKNPQLTADAIAQSQRIGEMISGITIYLSAPLLIVFGAVLIWLGAKIVSASLSFDRAMLIASLSQIPRLLSWLLTTVQGLLMDTSTINSMHDIGYSPARFMNQDAFSAPLLGAIARFDVFTLWTTFLLGVGVAVIAKVPRARGYAAAGIAWAIPTALGLLAFIWA